MVDGSIVSSPEYSISESIIEAFIMILLPNYDTMKGTKVLTLGDGHYLYVSYTRGKNYCMVMRCDAHAIHVYACAVLLLVGWSIKFVVAYRLAESQCHWLATLLDSTRESTLALRCNFWCLKGTQSWSR